MALCHRLFSFLAERRMTLFHSVLLASSLLVVILVLVLVREVRLRRALQQLLHNLLARWSNYHEANRNRDDNPE
jgi:hypothetical protein